MTLAQRKRAFYGKGTRTNAWARINEWWWNLSMAGWDHNQLRPKKNKSRCKIEVWNEPNFSLESTTCTKCEPETKSNKRHAGCGKLAVVNITFTTVTGITITVVASIGFILTVLVCGNYVKFYNNPLGRISILLLFGMHFSSFNFNRTWTCRAQQITLQCSHILTLFFPQYFYYGCALFEGIISVFEVDKVAQLFALLQKPKNAKSLPFCYEFNSPLFAKGLNPGVIS